MNIDNSKNKKEIDLFDLIGIVANNFLLFISIVFTFVAIGLVYYFTVPFVPYGLNKHTVNVLIDHNLYTGSGEDKIYSGTIIVNSLNDLLSSSYNYEEWRSINPILSDYLPQTHISNLQVKHQVHTFQTDYTSNNKLRAIKSYLKFTINTVAKKINARNEKEILRQMVNIRDL